MRMLAVLIPIFCFIALLKRENFRESFLISAIVNGLFVSFSTEMLSLFDAVAYKPIVAFWSTLLIILLVRRFREKGEMKCPATELTAFQKILFALLACIIGIAGITAIVAAPNNFDSLTYHLPRMLHWIQNGSVEHYPTHIDRQLALAPFSEYVIMHLQILSGSDRFANCVQWFSMFGSAVAVSLIARALQGSINSQLVAAVLAVSVPMGLLQATSTQNDYVVTFWLACLVYFIIKTKASPAPKHAIMVGVSLALAIFTKGTAYLVALPFMLVYLWSLVAQGVRPAARNLLIVFSMILLVNGGHYGRNFRIYGNPISAGTGNDIVCTKFDMASLASGVTKNIATQLACSLPGVNASLYALSNFVHRVIGVDTTDPALTVDGGFAILPARVHEDFAPNPLHMALLLVGTLTLIWRRKKYPLDTKLFAATAMLAFVVVSVAIKWNPFISRYFLPVFIISAPCISLLYDGTKLRTVVNSGAIALLVMSIIILGKNEMRPLIGPHSIFVTSRIDQYFMVNPQAKPYFMATANMIKGQPITNVGIQDRDGNMWEYLLWVLLQGGPVTYRIEHVGVMNNSGRIMLKDFAPYFPVMI